MNLNTLSIIASVNIIYLHKNIKKKHHFRMIETFWEIWPGGSLF